jgi:hypothetical protein
VVNTAAPVWVNIDRHPAEGGMRRRKERKKERKKKRERERKRKKGRKSVGPNLPDGIGLFHVPIPQLRIQVHLNR